MVDQTRFETNFFPQYGGENLQRCILLDNWFYDLTRYKHWFFLNWYPRPRLHVFCLVRLAATSLEISFRCFAFSWLKLRVILQPWKERNDPGLRKSKSHFALEQVDSKKRHTSSAKTRFSGIHLSWQPFRFLLYYLYITLISVICHLLVSLGTLGDFKNRYEKVNKNQKRGSYKFANRVSRGLQRRVCNSMKSLWCFLLLVQQSRWYQTMLRNLFKYVTFSALRLKSSFFTFLCML